MPLYIKWLELEFNKSKETSRQKEAKSALDIKQKQVDIAETVAETAAETAAEKPLPPKKRAKK